MIWTEKYRPANINNIINTDIKQMMVNNNLNDIPHLLFYGPPGTGKTTSAMTICSYIYKNNIKILKERVLELNASDDRGIKIVRDKIKTFANKAINPYKNIPDIKMIILDEADAMTNDSQFALRRIIEQYSINTRFILISNYITKIIPPLSSRCTKFMFKILDNNKITQILSNIISTEKINCNQHEIIDFINKYSNGDIRYSINILQRANTISRLTNKPINHQLLNHILNKIPEHIINDLMNLLLSKSNIYVTLINKINHIINEGYNIFDLLNNICTYIVTNDSLQENFKSLVLLKISNTINIITSGTGDFINILALCSLINYYFIHPIPINH